MGILANYSGLISRPTGLTTYALNVLPHLAPLSPALAASPEIINTFAKENQLDGFSLLEVPAGCTAEHGRLGHLKRLLWVQKTLPKLLRKSCSSLIFSPVPESPLFLKHCRSVVTLHDLIPLRFGSRFSLLRQFFKHYVPSVLRQSEHIICDSISTARDVVDFFNISTHKLTCIYLGYDESNFYNLDLDHKQYFLYVGRHDPYKNLSRLISAFSKLKELRDYELWISGPTNPVYTQLIENYSIDLGIEANVKILDYIAYEKLPMIFNQAIALVFPSLWEGFGLPPLEAMACGTPVITSNLSSMPEVVGDAAILVDPYNVDELADAMAQVANDSQLRTHLCLAGLARAQQFSWEKTGQQTVEVLKRFL